MSPITAEPTARRSINFPVLIHTAVTSQPNSAAKQLPKAGPSNSHGPNLTRRLAPQHYYFCGEGEFSSHRSVNTTGTQLYPLPSLRKRPRGGNTDECGLAIKTPPPESLGSN